MAESETIVDAKQFIRDRFSTAVSIPSEEIFATNLTLAEIVKRSPSLTNSIDLMEAFARTANAVRRASGVRIRLQSFSLDTKIEVVLQAFLDQFDKLSVQT